MFDTAYQEFIFKRTYARWLEDENRREDWEEAVNRYCDFMIKRVPDAKHNEFKEAIYSVTYGAVMPSMRALWTAGAALERDNIAGYNCAYTEIDHPRKFAELLYILMCGTGIGFSVERQVINKLPNIPSSFKTSSTPIVFKDSKLGWAEGYYKVLSELLDGIHPKYDLLKIRPKGARLKTFGGRASGPEPLKELIEHTINLFKNAQGRKLNSLECHDLCCKIASAVMVGGVRRSACISLSNLSDDRMAKAKSGDWLFAYSYRQYANNSTAYTEQPDARKFLSEWMKLVESKSGERGIFNRKGAEFTVAKTSRRKIGYNWGANPCVEIILRPDQFCNLTEVVVHHSDGLEELKEKVRHATILGCVQSTLTDFKFISRQWKTNCEEERLLGVSLTGLRDHSILGKVSKQAREWLQAMKLEAIDTADKWSNILGIPMPKAITCVKPSGTVSQMVDCSSGLHPRPAPFYIRRVQVSAKDPISMLLIDAGVPHIPAPNEDRENPSTWAFEFPIMAPNGSVCADEISALDQLRYWKMLKDYWCEHNPSCTIKVKDSEWVEVGAWVYKNWDYICGLSFLPMDDNVYINPPQEEIDEDTYNKLAESFPNIDFSRLSEYEVSDKTEGSREYACGSGKCEI